MKMKSVYLPHGNMHQLTKEIWLHQNALEIVKHRKFINSAEE